MDTGYGKDAVSGGGPCQSRTPRSHHLTAPRATIPRYPSFSRALNIQKLEHSDVEDVEEASTAAFLEVILKPTEVCSKNLFVLRT